VRAEGQSGGVVSALLAHQIEAGNVERALVATMPEDGTLRPYSTFATTPQEVLHACASKYSPIVFAPSLGPEMQRSGTIAVVGVPCQIQTIRNTQIYSKWWRNQIALTIGLFCDQVLLYGAMDFLVQSAGVEREEVHDVRFKHKRHGDFPGDFRIRRKEGEPVYLPNRHRLSCKRAFTPNRCRLCFDKMNAFCDIAVGDTWGIAASKDGLSAVLARTTKGLETLSVAEKERAIKLEPVRPEAVFRGQGVHKKRQTWANYVAAWQKMGRPIPESHVSPEFHPPAQTGVTLSRVTGELRDSDRVASQRTSALALKEARRQLLRKKLTGWMSWKAVRRKIGKWRRLLP